MAWNDNYNRRKKQFVPLQSIDTDEELIPQSALDGEEQIVKKSIPKADTGMAQTVKNIEDFEALFSKPSEEEEYPLDDDSHWQAPLSKEREDERVLPPDAGDPEWNKMYEEDMNAPEYTPPLDDDKDVPPLEPATALTMKEEYTPKSELVLDPQTKEDELTEADLEDDTPMTTAEILARYQSLKDPYSYGDAYNRQKSQEHLLNMIKAGDIIGRSISGASIKPIDVEHLYQQNTQVQDTKDLEENDPESELSNNYRELVASTLDSVAPEVALKIRSSNLSYAKLKAQYNMLMNYASTKTAALAKEALEQSKLNAETKEKEKKLLDDSRKNTIELSENIRKSPTFKDYNAINSAFEKAATSLRDYKMANPSGKVAKQVLLLYTFIRSLDPNSAVRESEIALAQSGIGLPEIAKLKAARTYQEAAGIISPKLAEAFLKSMKQSRDSAYKLLSADIDRQTRQYKDLDFHPRYVDTIKKSILGDVNNLNISEPSEKPKTVQIKLSQAEQAKMDEEIAKRNAAKKVQK